MKIKLNIKEAMRKQPTIVLQACFMIFTLFIAMFAFSVLLALPSQVVAAQDYNAACCEKLDGSDLYCQDSLSTFCDENFASAPTSCESTSFCKLGCCYDSVEGTCAENTPKKLCEIRGGTWDSQRECKIAQCSLGCCVLGDDASLTTLVRCKKLASYYGLETNYQGHITNEEQCIALAQASDKGACIIETSVGEKTCKFTTRADCKSITADDSAFKKDFLCSAEELGTTCARQHHTGCIEGKDEVYWFDSCGNPENIYDSDKTRSYNNGKILTKENSCNANSPNVNNQHCGNCDYFIGSMCGQYRSTKGEPKPKYGDYICRDLNCPLTSNGKTYKHGESWCIYDEPVGDGKDSVGSRHWRHLCVQGEEKVEPCDDFRQGICIEDEYDIADSTFNEALCRPNRWRDCISITDKDDCEDKAKRDCYWNEGGAIGSLCLPNVPGGLKFWDAGGQAKTLCAAGSRTAVAIFEKKPLGDWECIQNCEVLEEGWTQSMNKICTSLGDCGAYINYIGKTTDDGYQISDEGEKLSTEYGKELGEGFGKVGLAYLGTMLLISTERIILKLSGIALPKGAAIIDIWGTGGRFLKAFPAAARTAGNALKWAVSGGKGIGGSQILQPMKNLLTPLSEGEAYRQASKQILQQKFGDGVSWIKGGEILRTQPDAVIGGLKYKGGAYVWNPKTSGFDFVSANKGLPTDFRAVLPIDKPLIDVVPKPGTYGSVPGYEQMRFEQLTGGKEIPSKLLPQPTGLQSLMGNLIAFAQFALMVYSIYSLVKMVMTLLTKHKQVTVTFTCLPWQAPSGGDDCEECNGDDMKPCSEYRCKSLGVTCSLLNIGTGNETCVDLNPDDTTSPRIEPWEEVLTSRHSYQDVKPCPPGPGCWKIARTGAEENCIKAFTPLEFGISTNEPAQCKVDYEHTDNFDDMSFWFGETNLYLYKRSMKMSLPGPEHINRQSPEIKNDGKYTLYVRCRDGNGNANLGEMAVEFCVEPGPDTTPAKVERTSIDNGAPVSYGTTEADLDIYLNEPAECMWSFEDQDYENMENAFDCATRIEQLELDLTYKCSGTLTDIDDQVTNTYYIRCKDQPWLDAGNDSDRNVNKESYVFKLEGTEPLYISSTLPNGTIEWGEEPTTVKLEVETENGYSNGKSTCYFSPEGYDTMIEFFETDASYHYQELTLPAGSYTYYILCRDLAGNTDKSETKFTAEVDNTAPMIVRVYQDAGMLKLITDEDSDCKYSIKDCKFDFTTATEMPFDGTTEHTAEWRTDITYYIKCMDEFGNLPAQSECSMQVNAYDVETSN